VRRYLRSEGLPRYERDARPSKLDPHKQYIDKRVKAAAPDRIPATVLLRELKALAYQGGYSILKDYLATLHPVAEPEPLIRFETDPWAPDAGRLRDYSARARVSVHCDPRLESRGLRRIRQR
jgi:transposase